MSVQTPEDRKFTTLDCQRKKERGEPIVMLTAYDYAMAVLLDRAGVDAILVGDSLAMVALGHPNTLPVTMDEMLHHCRAVSRGTRRAMLIGDMPFLSYQVSPAEAVRNAGRFLQEAGMNAVKLEGGRAMLPAVESIGEAGIPVLGHLGLTPQSLHKLGGMRAQGRTSETAKIIFEDALLLQHAGCFGLVLESVPARLAAAISRKLTIPVIGIGAGVGCDGQVLVTNDLLGLYDRGSPRFVRRYADLSSEIVQAVGSYQKDVTSREFPAHEHETEMPDEEWSRFAEWVDGRG